MNETDLLSDLVFAIRHLQDAVSAGHRVVHCSTCARADELAAEAIRFTEKAKSVADDLIKRVYKTAEIPVALATEIGAALNSLRLKDAQIAALKAQLPPEMQHCTIRFVACKKGHGRLVGTDWTDYLADEGCLKCKLDALTAPRAKNLRAPTLVPTMRLRWRQVFNIEHETVLVLDHPERGPARYVLEQAFHRPDASEYVWSEIEVDAP